MNAELARKLWRYDLRTGHLWWREKPANNVDMSKPAGSGENFYRRIKHQEKHYYAHRLVWLIVTGTWPQHEIDHINGNGLDNRWKNLRPANHKENMRNRRKQKNNSTGFKGVHWNKAAKKYRAEISNNGKLVHLGLFLTAEEAAAAYEAKARELFGEFYRDEE